MKNTYWTIEKIKDGFNRFQTEYGRLPTVSEIDALDYLPSSRHIQKTFGGLVRLRTELGFEFAHFGKGIFRTEIATRVNKRGRDVEMALEKILRSMFGEVFVHTERLFDASKNRIDFFVYSPDGNFGIDVFYPDDMRTLQGNLNIKMNKYRTFSLPLFYVIANEGFLQKDLDEYVESKIRPLSKNARLVTITTLIDILKNKRPYPDIKLFS